MDSCKGFWMLIILMMTIGAGYLVAAKKLIDWWIKS
jgi:hypothetical protein